MKKRQYIFISNGYKGGATRFINDHLKYVSNLNKETILIDDNPNKTFDEIPKSTIKEKIKINYFSLNSEKKLKKIFFKHDGEKIVFLTNYAFFIKYFFLINKLKKYKIKLILTIHSGLTELKIKNILAGFLFSLFYFKIDYLYFGSNSAKNWWLKFYPWMKIKKNMVHYNGVDLPKKVKPRRIKKNISISFAGRLEKENNPEFFLKIANKYFEDNNDTVFNIYGEGTLKNYLKSQSKNKNIKFHGWTEKKKIFKNSDIIMITSPINNYPYVALEAKSFGIPVISCSKGDISKIIKNEIDGFIKHTNSTSKTVDLIYKITKNYYRFSKNCINRSGHYNLNIACKKFWKRIK